MARTGGLVRRQTLTLGVGVVLVATLLFGETAAGAPGRGQQKLEVYQATVPRAQVTRLARAGYDIAATRSVEGGVQVDLVLSDVERKRLEREGVQVAPRRNRDGLTATQLAAQQAAAGYKVWRSFDQRGGI